MNLERGPGHDWVVKYRFEDEAEEVMSVFGQMTAEDALREARFSLDGIGNENAGTYEILAVERA